MRTILWLKDVDKNSVAVAGGKGANLGELKKSGFSVPDGFVISCVLYDKITENGLKEKIEIPKDAEKEIIDAYRKLGGPVAVRSSATAEDSKSASFAGQQDTFLGVDETGLIGSIEKCMASLFSPRAVSYRAQKNIPLRDVSIAVVIQKMAASKKAGVAFSANPVTGNKGEIIIEAASGPCVQVVGGQIIPDNYVIEKESGKIKERRTAKEQVLSDSEIGALAALVAAIEKHYQSPQDIEWAIDGSGKIHILQARPITTLDSVQKPAWKKIMAREYGVQYTEMSLRSLSPECDFIVRAPFYGQAYIPEDKNEALYVNEAEWDAFVSSLKKEYLEKPKNYESFEKQFMETGSSYVETAERISSSNLKEKANPELKKAYIEYQRTSLRYAPFIWIQFLINNFFAEAAKGIISSKTGSGNPHALYDIALRPDKKAASIQLSELASGWEKLDDAGKTEIYEKFMWLPCMDIHNRPWTKEEFASHVSDLGKHAKKPDAVTVSSYGALIAAINPSNEEMQLLDIAKRLAYLKDLKDDFRRQGVFYGRILFEEIARRMAIKAEDASYLLEAEIVGFLDNGSAGPKNIIESRKSGFVIYYTYEKKIACKSGSGLRPALSELGISVAASGKISEEIKGVPASLGRAKGIVRIVRTISDLAKVKKGDILVAITTHPDYVPAMQKAAAIVTDEGGITSHAAIVARELRLPCIVGTRHATKSLKDGDEIEVDANAGIVKKIKK